MNDSLIHEMMRQYNHGDGEWKNFLESIAITNIHGWSGQKMQFRFPVVAIVGENGIGKSTFLKAALCAYKVTNSDNDYYPSKMFMNTQWDELYLGGATIEYGLRLGDDRKKVWWRKRSGWGYTPKGNKPKRHVIYFGIGRTLPKDATAGYVKIAMNSNEEAGKMIELDNESRDRFSYVMGRDYTNARFVGTEISDDKEIGLLTTDDIGEISQFHQGAGEDSVLDMFRVLANIPNQSLLVIDEVENSLHPRAQRRLVQYLLDLSRKKKIQIILSTHSAYVLDELPPVARIMLMRLSDQKEILYGISSEFALSTIDDESHPELYVFVEDEEAEMLFWEIMKCIEGRYEELVKRVATQVAGSSSIIKTLDFLAKSNRLPYRSLAIVDGDKSDECEGCVSLPGSKAPERQVFEDFKAINWDHLDERFGMGAGMLFQILDDALLLPDHYDWTTYVGDKVKKSKQTVWQIMIEEWCKQCLDKEKAHELVDAVVRELN